MRRESGFSLLEMTMAMGLMLVVTASVFSLMNPAQGSFSTEPEVADMQQRLRVAQDTLYKDLVMAGAGAYLGKQTGSLNYFFAPVLPFRQGAVGDAPIGSYTTDTITIFYVPSTTAQTTLKLPLSAGNAVATTNGQTDCPLKAGQPDPLCGFTAGMTLLIFDDTGNYDGFTVTALNSTTATLTVNKPPDAIATTYPGCDTAATPGCRTSKVVQAIERTYYLKTDAANKTYQLVYYDGSTAADVPVVDNVVDLQFEYWADPQPPTRITSKPLTDQIGPWTTYGPKPPAPTEKPTAYPMGENCVFGAAVACIHPPRLPVLPSGTNPNGLVKLKNTDLNDGPWCPDQNNANRFDADLFRVRKIGVTVRVQAANEAMRGPASVLFKVGGTSRGGNKWVPDQEVRFTVSPRNLNLGR
jgi:Tfp pilus assembly protein PilW